MDRQYLKDAESFARQDAIEPAVSSAASVLTLKKARHDISDYTEHTQSYMITAYMAASITTTEFGYRVKTG